MSISVTARDRLLAALDHREPDRVPCAFMLFAGLRDRSRSHEEFIEEQLRMGLDAFVMLPPFQPGEVNDHRDLPGLPVNFDPRVTVKEWVEHPVGEDQPLMIKEYSTPGGVLRAEVWQTDDWPYGNHVPFLDDYIEPRSRKFLVSRAEDLDALRFLLVPPTQEDKDAYTRICAPAIALAHDRGLLIAGGRGVGADLLAWILGYENQMFAVYDDPGLVRSLLDLVASWNAARMSVVLDAGIDLYLKRAWYENLDFWTPATWREFLLPIVRADAELAHSRGAKFGYIISSNCMALLPLFAEAGVDVLMGVDPREWDLQATKDSLAGRVSLWGGVNGHLTVELGDEEAVRAEVRRAMEVLSPGGGFILSPVDNVREDTDRSRRNVAALIDEWRAVTGRAVLE